jgi:hypothetical protein
LFNHNFRPSTTDNRFDRIGVKHIGDCRFEALLHQSLSFFWRAGQSNYSVSFGKQFRDQRTTDRSRSPCNKNLHL